ncbi:MAG TPA: redox-regulated ATPase YchF [bacterium]|nr:redox-regulated ATPase YchF [bacterium]
MGFKCGLVGLPNAGKSTVFNALTYQRVEASAYPFCTIDPHIGIVPLKDDRLSLIQELYHSRQSTPATLEFVDIAGLVRGASQGEGLGNQFLSHIQGMDLIAYIIRFFEDKNVSHPYGNIDPVRDNEIVTHELILKDLETVQSALEKARKSSRAGIAELRQEAEELESIETKLKEKIEVRKLDLTETGQEICRRLNLITFKPVLIIANIQEPGQESDSRFTGFHDTLKADPIITICGKIQSEISELPESERMDFVNAMGLESAGINKLVVAGYKALNLITFFTANENEARAWTVRSGTTVREAAGKVHSDFEDFFVKAEVIKIDELKEHGSIKALHDSGLVRIHGKQYLVEDGDLILFRTHRHTRKE